MPLLCSWCIMKLQLSRAYSRNVICHNMFYHAFNMHHFLKLLYIIQQNVCLNSVITSSSYSAQLWLQYNNSEVTGLSFAVSSAGCYNIQSVLCCNLLHAWHMIFIHIISCKLKIESVVLYIVI